ncbi:RNA polymerase subunit sigma-70 [Solitalea longa]|uniref:RNA polymerase subunit sigma-70 n=1 Tax=Solitalea longa TaxID=2079460 RepID=A0A2S5A264_9SPHI|nr:sigma-70 family RNA polymerase sigma factor [Solitalea longa]POY36688.1 RNA polymerase subunit sigma-70 [Solitalea longa]
MKLMHKIGLDELVVGCRNGNRKSQEALYKHFSSKMMGVCLRYTRDRDEAEDVLQVGFVRMFEKLHLYKGEGSFEGWLRRIMVNTAIEFYRRNSRMYPMVDLEEAENQSSNDLPLSNLNVQELLKLVQNLPPGYRMVFNMYAIEGYGHKEIADQLGISEGTSKSQLNRARTQLKEWILNMEGGSNVATIR